ncbi:AAA family ATPase [Burkholderia sp. Bp9012]|uniref:AAA family ATPase n=1 Tax=Burkholderia sp. Bp9012 TaxID=2184562 RepID=UPI00162575E8|nr:ATP-binding protein [Burkholderia sp. Bp9012]
MQKIIVKDFSCIKSATLAVAPLTLVIGPQASGKSVLSKLIYFCTNIISDYDRLVIEDNLSFEALERRIGSQFIEWFPISAWGSKRFSINFQLGEFELNITRIGKSERVRIKFCEQFVSFYKNSHDQFLAAIKKAEVKAAAKADLYDFELMWRLRQSATLNLRKWLGRDLVENQLFVPAGRSFFTSVGKALVAFEHSGILDPVTLEFGRRFSAIRERYIRRMPGVDVSQSSLAGILFSEILGGHLKTEGGKEYVQTADGRLIPFSALSSGQQELLPLAVAIRAMLPSGVPRQTGAVSGGVAVRRTIYIEEPEAHLFPRAQNKLVEILAALVARRRFNNLLLTTHSPYVLAKFNNLIKAGSLARSNKTGSNAAVAKIVPETSWVPSKSVNAYAIIDGHLTDIMDESGLIAADYLDDVSGDIAREFSQLLSIEVAR